MVYRAIERAELKGRRGGGGGEAIKQGRTIKKTELPSKRSAHKRRRGRDFPPRDGRSTMEARFLGENKRVVYTWTRNVNNEEVRLGWFARHN